MKTHLVERPYWISYPVGNYVLRNIEPVQKMADAILANREGSLNLQISCMGSSGAIVATLLTTMLKSYYDGISIVHVKKDGESSHNTDISFDYQNCQTIIVDDQIATGETMNFILEKITTRNTILPNSIEIYVSGEVYFKRISSEYHPFIKLVSAAEVLL